MKTRLHQDYITGEGTHLESNLVDCLIKSFNNKGIAYCHWKSNIDLEQATAGEMDLDLLIDRGSFDLAVSILSGLGFKPAVVFKGANPAGIFHFYGYDFDSDRYIHVHVFTRVLTGESFVKSHLLPFEAMLLQDGRYDGQIRLPSKAAELVLFTVRTYIKYGSLLDLMILARKSMKVKAELLWLKEGSDLSAVKILLNQYCPVIDEKLFLQCIHAIENDVNLIRRIDLALQVRRRIRHFSKHNFIEWSLSYLKLGIVTMQRKLGTRSKNKILQSGGMFIAIVGSDATGKSTVVAETKHWIGKTFAVRQVHAGKPPSTLITAPVNLVFQFLNNLNPNVRRKVKAKHASGEKNNSQAQEKGIASLLYAFRAVTLAWDRRYTILKAWRACAKGEIVVSDRYPSNVVGAMDSPRLEPVTGRGVIARLYNLAARIEQDLYAQLPPPNLVIRLQVSVETAIERNRSRSKEGSEPDKYIESRHWSSGAWNRSDVMKIFDVDTEQPLHLTMHQVKNAVWRSI